MLFNSLTFLVFLLIVFSLYWLLNRYLSLQNFLLVVASYIFYGWWDYRFLSLIVISSLADYLIGSRLQDERRPGHRRGLVVLSLTLNLGMLGAFKYYDFFVDSLAELLLRLGLQPHVTTLNVILPVGISFYTFQTLSYTLDIYRRRIEATRDPIAFFAFVSFFPQLVAGPIERAKNLLPQVLKSRKFDLGEAKDGLRLMLWGMFKKVVIADNVAGHVDAIYADPTSLDSTILFIGTFLFAVQIYCDFSGYSDIAIGAARLFGIRLMRNFAFPYFARNIGEFWRRWHISLSTWFRDYVYVPLGGSRTTTRRRMVNIVVTFMVSGFWHGANWTFLVWGLLHGLYYIPLMLAGTHRRYTNVVAEGRLLPSGREFVSMMVTFLLVWFGWIFFRAQSMTHALAYIGTFFRGPIIDRSHWHGRYLGALTLCFLLLAAEWVQRHKQHGMDIQHMNIVGRWSLYTLVTLAVLFLGNFGAVDFIYFQF